MKGQIAVCTSSLDALPVMGLGMRSMYGVCVRVCVCVCMRACVCVHALWAGDRRHAWAGEESHAGGWGQEGLNTCNGMSPNA